MVAIIGVGLALAACAGLDGEVCANGLRCPVGKQCAADLDVCVIGTCGDGVVDSDVGEVCDDGNLESGDGCSRDCLSQSCMSADQCAVDRCMDGRCPDGRIDGAGHHTCAITSTGALRCWGDGLNGRLGYGNESDIGDDEYPVSAGDVAVSDSGAVVQVSTGRDHTCALLDTGDVRCWGNGTYGQLGYGDQAHVGDDESPAMRGDVMVGGKVTQLAAGGAHTCALLDSGDVWCWGYIGGLDTTLYPVEVPIGGAVSQLAAGDLHTCALLQDRTVKCWGNGESGQLGYGHEGDLGDEPGSQPSSNPHVQVGGDVSQLVAGAEHTCALLDTGDVRCWGANDCGQLGNGNTTPVGDDEHPASVLGTVQFTERVVQLAAGAYHNCALLNTGDVHCWGMNIAGQLGYPGAGHVGDDELPSAWGPVNLRASATVVEIAAGYYHTCALLDNDDVYCWGYGMSGQLGYGNMDHIGDDEHPYEAGPVPYRDADAP